MQKMNRDHRFFACNILKNMAVKGARTCVSRLFCRFSYGSSWISTPGVVNMGFNLIISSNI